MPNAAIYIRTGPGVPEDSATQEALARKAAADLGFRCAALLRDGSGTRRGRLETVLAGSGQPFDVLVVARLALLAPGLPHLLQRLAALAQSGMMVVEVAGPRTVDPSGVGAAVLLDAQADYRREAVAAGRARARARGVRFGRPPIPDAKRERALAALAAGAGVRAAARVAGLSPASVIRCRDAQHG